MHKQHFTQFLDILNQFEEHGDHIGEITEAFEKVEVGNGNS